MEETDTKDTKITTKGWTTIDAGKEATGKIGRMAAETRATVAAMRVVLAERACGGEMKTGTMKEERGNDEMMGERDEKSDT